ncbi:MAG: F0F1 ATP synthase subunit A [Sedimentisphaerales bacterium]|nr:F0F1 ATP synthase subunit A [Sedimentisphaerales bacterium]
MGPIRPLLAMTSPIEHFTSKPLFSVFGLFNFTSHMFVVTLATVVLLVVMPLIFHRRPLVRSGFGNALEAICLYLREEVARPFLHERTDKYIGYIWTIFFFILTMNLLGIMPVDKIVLLASGMRLRHWGGAPTANIWITGTLAFCAFLLFHMAGIRENGLVKYIQNFSPKVPWPLMPFMFFMELVSSCVRMFSLAIRLFANIMAGHILLAALFMFIVIFQNPFAATASTLAQVVMTIMEIFVAFLQAYIFTFLTTIFIGMAVHPEH